MLPVSKDILDVAMLNLQRYVAPEVTSENGQVALVMINYVLGAAYVEEHDLPELQAERHRKLQPVFDDILTELDSIDIDEQTEFVGDARALVFAARRSPQDVESTDRALQVALQATAAPGRSGDVSLSGWRSRLAVIDTAFVEDLADRVDAWAYGAKAGAQETEGRSQRQLTEAVVTDLLREQLPDHPGITVAKISEIAGGFSKKTYILDIENGPKGWARSVIRQDAIGGPTPMSAIGEVKAISLAREYGVPAPAVLHVESSKRLDAPFVIFERSSGVCDINKWKETDSNGKLPGEALARHLATLHAIPLGRLNGSTNSSPREVIAGYINGFERRWKRDRPIADPLMEFAVQWLMTNIPTNIEKLSIVHADISDRNILVEDGEIHAILDWELWHVGDPMYDIAYVKPFVEQSMDWDRFVSIYEAESGLSVSMRNEDYWFIFSEVRNSLMLATALRTFNEGRNRNIKTIGPVMGHYRNRLRLAMRRLGPLLD